MIYLKILRVYIRINVFNRLDEVLKIYIMNLHRMINRMKRARKRHSRRFKRLKRNIINRFGANPLIYISYILIVSFLGAAFIQLEPNGVIRSWHSMLTHKETINKACELDVNEDNFLMGTFFSHYSFEEFGATDPTEIDPNAPMIAFTFDDGPSAESTQRILDALAANYSHATFFVVGRQTEQFPEKLQAILSFGCELGNHTFDHANLTELSSEDVYEQIDSVDRSVNKATGEETTLIRPPYGAYNDEVMSELDKPVILWDIDSEDWSSRNAQTICDKVLSEVKDGDIVLMHDIYESTADAVELMLPKLKEQGYQIVSVSEMAEYRGKTLELGKAYGKFGE